MRTAVLGVMTMFVLASCSYWTDLDETTDSDYPPVTSVEPTADVDDLGEASTPARHPAEIVYVGDALTPAAVFDESDIDIPEGNALYLELFVDDAGYSYDCYPALGDECLAEYWFENDRLSGTVDMGDPQEAQVLLAVNDAHPDACDALLAIMTLPYTVSVSRVDKYEPSATAITIRAINSDGSALAEMDGMRMWLPSKESWERKITFDDGQGCVAEISDKLTNHGLLSGDQIDLE